MSWIITFIFEPAKLQMNWARARGRSNLRCDKPGRSVEISTSGRTFSVISWFPRAGAHPGNDDSDHGDQVQLPEHSLEDGEHPPEVPGRRVVAVAERRERDKAEVEADRPRAIRALGKEVP